MTGLTFSQSDYEEFKETKRQNLFEEVIDQMMVDNYLPEKFKDKISKLPLRIKRRAIFTFIDENSHFVLNELDKLPEDAKLIDKFRIALEGLKKYIEVGKQEVKKFGEVFTPLELVEEMLDTLPKEVWSNPELKWLDPASGMGNFPLIVIKRLMVGLKSWESDPNKRYKHIVENMIYVCELQPRNAFMYLYLVDPHDIYDINLYCGSFLVEEFDNHMKEVWSVDKFDIIMGNPPYNNDGGLKTGGKNLYQKFISNSLRLYNLFTLLVTPPGFYKTTIFDKKNQIFDDITSKHSLIYLNCMDINDKYFKVGTPIVYYLIKNERYDKKTIIYNGESIIEVDVSEFNFIPRIVTKETYSILRKLGKSGERMIVHRDDRAKLKIEKFLTLSTMNHLSNKGYWNVSIGSESNRKRIIIESEDPISLENIINHRLYRFIFYAYRHDGAVYHRFLSGFRIPSNMKVDLYNYFDITNDEISFIEENIKD